MSEWLCYGGHVPLAYYQFLEFLDMSMVVVVVNQAALRGPFKWH